LAIAPESAPDHPIVKEFEAKLKRELEEPLKFHTLFYSDNSLFNFLSQLRSATTSSDWAKGHFCFWPGAVAQTKA
jgi:hypothetical protein